MPFVPAQQVRHFVCALVCATLLASACGGRSAELGNGPQAAAGSAGSSSQPTVGGGGAATSAEGGATAPSDAGSAAVGAATSGGSAQISKCDQVICAPLPTTCKRIVQGPEDCCPTCPETGCDECPEIACDEGTHAETAPGDCCPSCLPDPPDACTQGQKSYADFRAQLLEKYSGTGCKNSAQCGLVKEDNACAFACNIPLPTQTVHSFVDNLASAAASDCSSCAAPAPARCESQVAACVNGKCAAAEVERP